MNMAHAIALTGSSAGGAPPTADQLVEIALLAAAGFWADLKHSYCTGSPVTSVALRVGNATFGPFSDNGIDAGSRPTLVTDGDGVEGLGFNGTASTAGTSLESDAAAAAFNFLHNTTPSFYFHVFRCSATPVGVTNTLCDSTNRGAGNIGVNVEYFSHLTDCRAHVFNGTGTPCVAALPDINGIIPGDKGIWACRKYHDGSVWRLATYINGAEVTDTAFTGADPSDSNASLGFAIGRTSSAYNNNFTGEKYGFGGCPDPGEAAILEILANLNTYYVVS